MQPTSSTDPPTVYRAVNADGDPVEVCISRDIEVVSHEYLDAAQVRERFEVGQE